MCAGRGLGTTHRRDVWGKQAEHGVHHEGRAAVAEVAVIHEKIQGLPLQLRVFGQQVLPGAFIVGGGGGGHEHLDVVNNGEDDILGQQHQDVINLAWGGGHVGLPERGLGLNKPDARIVDPEGWDLGSAGGDQDRGGVKICRALIRGGGNDCGSGSGRHKDDLL